MTNPTRSSSDAGTGMVGVLAGHRAPYYCDEAVTLWHGDSLEILREMPDQSVDCCVTSPPYFGLRDYGEAGQYGLESSPAEYVETMRAVFSEVRRVLADDGTLWLNLGDSYFRRDGASVSPPRRRGKGLLPAKNMLGIPWRVAFALQDEGWILRSDIIWAKPNPMPESVTDRPTSSHEHVFLLTKSKTYHYDGSAIAETATGQASGNGFNRPESISRNGPGQEDGWQGRPQLRRALQLATDKGLTEHHFAAIRAIGMNDAGKAKVNQSGDGKNTAEMQRLASEAKAALGGYYREFLTGGTKNARDVWSVPVVGFAEAHFACMPPTLAERCVTAGCKPGGTVLDPFSGSGTTGLASAKHGRKYVGIDLNREYLDLSLRTRLGQTSLLDGGVA